MTFAELGISRPVTDALSKRGITAPFAVQKLVIEDVLDEHDVLVQSPTGSGKTLAFGLPLVELIEASDRRPAALILAPTRELALQIVDEIHPIATARALSIAPVYGGVGIEKQAKKAARAHIVVACPGRLEDLLDRGYFKLDNVRMLVIDEADRMLDMGFKPAVDRIVAKTPRDRQTLFFSATLEAAAGKVARAYTHEPESTSTSRSRPTSARPLTASSTSPTRTRPRRSSPSSSTPSAGGRWSSSAPSTAPTGSCASSAGRRSTRLRCTATNRRTSASGRSPSSRRARSRR